MVDYARVLTVGTLGTLVDLELHPLDRNLLLVLVFVSDESTQVGNDAVYDGIGEPLQPRPAAAALPDMPEGIGDLGDCKCESAAPSEGCRKARNLRTQARALQAAISLLGDNPPSIAMAVPSDPVSQHALTNVELENGCPFQLGADHPQNISGGAAEILHHIKKFSLPLVWCIIPEGWAVYTNSTHYFWKSPGIYVRAPSQSRAARHLLIASACAGTRCFATNTMSARSLCRCLQDAILLIGDLKRELLRLKKPVKEDEQREEKGARPSSARSGDTRTKVPLLSSDGRRGQSGLVLDTKDRQLPPYFLAIATADSSLVCHWALLLTVRMVVSRSVLPTKELFDTLWQYRREITQVDRHDYPEVDLCASILFGPALHAHFIKASTVTPNFEEEKTRMVERAAALSDDERSVLNEAAWWELLDHNLVDKLRKEGINDLQEESKRLGARYFYLQDCLAAVPMFTREQLKKKVVKLHGDGKERRTTKKVVADLTDERAFIARHYPWGTSKQSLDAEHFLRIGGYLGADLTPCEGASAYTTAYCIPKIQLKSSDLLADAKQRVQSARDTSTVAMRGYDILWHRETGVS